MRQPLLEAVRSALAAWDRRWLARQQLKQAEQMQGQQQKDMSGQMEGGAGARGWQRLQQRTNPQWQMQEQQCRQEAGALRRRATAGGGESAARQEGCMARQNRSIALPQHLRRSRQQQLWRRPHQEQRKEGSWGQASGARDAMRRAPRLRQPRLQEVLPQVLAGQRRLQGVQAPQSLRR